MKNSKLLKLVMLCLFVFGGIALSQAQTLTQPTLLERVDPFMTREDYLAQQNKVDEVKAAQLDMFVHPDLQFTDPNAYNLEKEAKYAELNLAEELQKMEAEFGFSIPVEFLTGNMDKDLAYLKENYDLLKRLAIMHDLLDAQMLSGGLTSKYVNGINDIMLQIKNN